MNPIDRVIGWIAPAAGLRRLQARAAIDIVTASRGYDGAKRGRRGNGRSPSTSANAEVGPAQVMLRNRARDLVRNNPHAARIVDVLTANLVGAGIQPVSKTGRKSVDKKVNALWSQFAATADADGQLDIYGLQALAVREMVQSGESVSRFRMRLPEDGLAVPLQIQVMEPDHIDSSKDAFANGERTLLGVAFNKIGARRGYWLFREHPGEQRQLQPLESVFVPAEEVMHLFRKQRPGQVRGVTVFAPIMMMTRDHADFHEAAVTKGRIEACFAGFVKNTEGEPVQVGADGKASPATGLPVQTIEPGMLHRLNPGEDVVFAQPTSSPIFDSFMVHTLMAIAIGAGVTYDQLTGDLRQANYSSLRAGKIEFRRLVEQIQYHVIIPMLCVPTWRKFIETAILTGALPRRPEGYPVDWITPANEPIDPVKDMTADILAVRSGRMTVAQFFASWGNDPMTQLEEIQKYNKLLDDMGIVLDIDPRKVARAGSAQPTTPAPEAEPADQA